MPHKAEDVANWFILTAAKHGNLTTHLKVQKLLYYAEVWTQVCLGKELFEEKIEAWAHGPVVPEVFQKFKTYSWAQLPIPDENNVCNFPEDVTSILKQVFDTYGRFEASALEAMTHTDEPWIKARGGIAPEARCNTVIPKEEIKQYFLKKYAEALNHESS